MTNTDLQELINSSAKNSKNKGFHDDGDILRNILAVSGDDPSYISLDNGDTIEVPREFWERVYAAYQGNRIMLAVGELVEAHEELRSGKPDVYLGPDGKPEGVTVELADAVIRIADFVGETDRDLVEAIPLKAEYNKTRSRMHGKQF